MNLNDSNTRGTDERLIRLARPSVVVLCGPASSGKSTFAARHFRPTQVISSDRCRALVSDDEQDQRFHAQAFALLDFLVEQRLDINRLCVVDSTALTQGARRSLLDLARRRRAPCAIFLFETPLEVCLARDAARERSVGQSVIERQYQAFEQAKSAIPQEGFDQVVELREEDLDKVRIEIVFRPVPRTAPGPPRPEARRSAPRVAGGGVARDSGSASRRPGAAPAAPTEETRTGSDHRPAEPGTPARAPWKPETRQQSSETGASENSSSSSSKETGKGES